MITGGTHNNKTGMWSHDGSVIVFKPDSNGKWAIFAMKANGSAIKLLTNDCEEFGLPVWSADDKQIFYTAAGNGATRIWVMNADGCGAHPLVR